MASDSRTPLASAPRFSVVIPTYGRPRQLSECLAALTRQDYPRHRFEVIVIDDGSGDPPADIVAAVQPEISVHLMALPRNCGPATARNVGATHAQGEFLAFLDDDCIPRPNWLTALERQLREDPQALLGGGLRNGARRNLPAEASHQLVQFLDVYYNVDPADACWFTSANIACSRACYNAVGGFGSGFPLPAAEDRDLCDRWREAGFRLRSAPDAIADHTRSMNLRQFWRQHFTYGRGAHYLHQARVQRGATAFAVEPVRFYGRLVSYPVAARSGWRSPLLSVLLVLSQFAYAAGYFVERSRAARMGRAARQVLAKPSVGDGLPRPAADPAPVGASIRTNSIRN